MEKVERIKEIENRIVTLKKRFIRVDYEIDYIDDAGFLLQALAGKDRELADLMEANKIVGQQWKEELDKRCKLEAELEGEREKASYLNGERFKLLDIMEKQADQLADLQARLKPVEEVFVVTMYRFGDHERHSYVLGVFDDFEKAKVEAKSEQINRGGNKYLPEIILVKMGDVKKRHVVAGYNKEGHWFEKAAQKETT